jgi:uncharacterized protein YjbI with pentapeptide repeats
MLRIILIAASIIVVLVASLALLDRLVPGLAVQTLAVGGAVIGALLALGGVLITQGVNVYTARSNTQDDALQKYLDDPKVSKVLGDRQLSEAQQSAGDRAATMAKTRSLLLRLDRNRKRVLLQFFHDAKLLEKERPLIELSGANLSGANLEAIDLGRDSLRGANLRGVDLRSGNLSSADLEGADLGNIGWNDASFAALIWIYVRDLFSNSPSSAKLSGINLSKADLSGADLSAADLSGANIQGATGVTNQRLEQQARSLEGATMPDGSKHP